MPSSENNPVSIPFRCDGFIDPFTGAVEVRTVECEKMPEMESVIRKRLQSLRRWSFTVSKLRFLILLIFLATLLAAVYGALHNQLSYTVAPEYFTKIKFRQFGIEPKHFGGDRLGAALVGVASTWWVGAIAATVLGLVGMIHPDRTMFRRTFRALWLMLAVAVVFGLLGLAGGEILSACLTWAPPERNALDAPAQVLAVVVMHNAGYLGGLVGLVVGIVDLRRIAKLVQKA